MLNEQGYHRPTYSEILNNKIQQAKELFGEDIETSEQTALGKFIRIGAKDLASAYEDLEGIYYSRFPNTASGISLDRLCVFAGISRNPATYASLIITVNGEENTKIDEIKVCSEDGKIIFHNIEPFVIPTSGLIDITVECETSGEAGNIKVINENPVESIAGVDSVTFVKIETDGEEAENDYELRKRFSVAIEGIGSTNVNAIRASLLRVPTVVSAGVIVNDTDDVDEKGRPARSFECFVYGGENYKQEIAQAIFEKAPIGIKTCSTVTPTPDWLPVSVFDDGGYEHEIYFSFTQNVSINITISYKKDNKFEADGETQIKNILTDYSRIFNIVSFFASHGIS